MGFLVFYFIAVFAFPPPFPVSFPLASFPASFLHTSSPFKPDYVHFFLLTLL